MQKGIRLVGLIAADVILINLSYLIAMLLRYDFAPESTAFSTCLEVWLGTWVFLSLIKIVFFFLFGLYSTLWRYACLQDVLRVFGGVAAANLVTGALLLLIFKNGMPSGVVIIAFLVDMLLVGGIRLMYRFAADLLIMGRRRIGKNTRRTMVIGSGYAVTTLIKEIKISSKPGKLVYNPVVVVNNNKNHKNRRIQGVKTEIGYKNISRIVRKYKVEEIIAIIPNTMKREKEIIIEECRKTDCDFRILPTLSEMIDGGYEAEDEAAEIDIDEVIPFERIDINEREIMHCFKGRIVMVAGAGRPAGIAICREVCNYAPRKLIAFDTAESGLSELSRELRIDYPHVEIQTVICSASGGRDVEEIFETGKPHIVIQAGLFTNEHLMEENAKEAANNNIFGTMRLINSCEKFSAERFILVSSDSAGRHEDVGGATAAAAEYMVKVKSHDKASKTIYSAVRVGNLLESRKNVVSIFKEQIENGGPVTILDEFENETFMTEDSASELILQAVAISSGGEIFGIKSSHKVDIVELAENLIKLYGLRPYEDIDIRVVGSKAEMGFETTSYDNNKSGFDIGGFSVPESGKDKQTSKKGYFKDTTCENLIVYLSEDFDSEEVQKNLSNLWTAVQTGDNQKVRTQLANLVSGYDGR